jgi:hypothetical protein
MSRRRIHFPKLFKHESKPAPRQPKDGKTRAKLTISHKPRKLEGQLLQSAADHSTLAARITKNGPKSTVVPSRFKPRFFHLAVRSPKTLYGAFKAFSVINKTIKTD